ncbi:metallophosphoesterase [Puniceibacterium confluentis]|uniref:metallophosphoesterase n=1 Tax=Puniceibacterium confluentis TaxID=1958944 RepID=UPI0011B42C21|nr:metallophosphoesterase [Puniceibacterium confluentis]
MTPIYAIGDIHGQVGELDGALARIEVDEDSSAPVVFLGDSVDRGPDSRAVLQTLIDGQARGRPWITLLGNHDRYMRNFLNGSGVRPPEYLDWLDPRIGGQSTLASYGVDADSRRHKSDIRADALQAVPQSHLKFLDNLHPMHETAEQIFVHAGLRPGIALAQQSEHDLIWIRDGFLEHTDDFGRLVVHGHTALRAPRHYGNRLNLDSGAGYGRPLTAALIRGRAAWNLTRDGRDPIPAP